MPTKYLQVVMNNYSSIIYSKALSFSIPVKKDYERRNYIQAETIYNKLKVKKY